MDYVNELAYRVMIVTARRIAEMDASGETEAAANEYQQHVSAMDAAAVAEFNRMLVNAAMYCTP